MAATAFPAAAIVSGTIATPRLGSGTADATSFLRGDSTWAVVPEVTRASLGLATTDSPTFAKVNTSEVRATGNALDLGDQLGTKWRAQGNSIFPIGNPSVSTIGWPTAPSWGSINEVAMQAAGYVNFANDAKVSRGATGPTVDARAAGGFRSRNLANDADAPITAGAARFGGLVEQRNGTNGQKSRLYKTYASATSGEWLELDAATDASNFDIAASIGSAGGTARGIRIGGKNAAGTFTPWLSFATTGAATFRSDNGSGTIFNIPGNTPYWLVKQSTNTTTRVSPFGIDSSGTGGLPDVGLARVSAGLYAINDNGSSVSTNYRDLILRDLTASGALQIGNAAVAETPAATHTLIIKDSTGTSYRVLAVAV